MYELSQPPELGRAAVANIVMLGFFTAAAGLVSVEAMKKSVLASVPKGTEELNRRALEAGFALAGSSKAA